jgi:hypothetical protein
MSAPETPLAFTWTGDSLIPLSKRWQKECDQRLVIGERYLMTEVQERSGASHRHYMASVTEAWSNLPEELADRFPNPDSLRKYALIKAGYRDERSIVCSSRAEAERLAAFIKPMDTYAVVALKDAVVIVYTAKSQSYRAMPKGEFQKSKDDVLDVLSKMIGVERAKLENARAA